MSVTLTGNTWTKNVVLEFGQLFTQDRTKNPRKKSKVLKYWSFCINLMVRFPFIILFCQCLPGLTCAHVFMDILFCKN